MSGTTRHFPRRQTDRPAALAAQAVRPTRWTCPPWGSLLITWVMSSSMPRQAASVTTMTLTLPLLKSSGSEALGRRPRKHFRLGAVAQELDVKFSTSRLLFRSQGAIAVSFLSPEENWHFSAAVTARSFHRPLQQPFEFRSRTTGFGLIQQRDVHDVAAERNAEKHGLPGFRGSDRQFA